MLYRKLYSFDYEEARDVPEAISLLQTHGTEAAVMAGGIGLIEEMKRRAVTPKVVVSLQPIDQLKFLDVSDGNLRIGALSKLSHGEQSNVVKEGFPALWEAIAQISSAQVRNMGTIVGNITACNPGSDVATALVALDASVKIADGNGGKCIPIKSFGVHSRKNILKPGEIVTEIIVPCLAPGAQTAFLNLARTKEDCAKVVVAVNARVTEGVIEDIKLPWVRWHQRL